MAQGNLGPPPDVSDPQFKDWLTQLYLQVVGGVGYGPGQGGTVIQATSKSTGVTLNKYSGAITMHNAALASGAYVSFVVSNSLVASTDIPYVIVSGGGTANAYKASVTAVAPGSFTVTVQNITAGSLSESPVVSFNLNRGVTA